MPVDVGIIELDNTNPEKDRAVSKFFEDYLGWTSILVEANPYNFKMLVKNRPQSINCNILYVNKNTSKLLDLKQSEVLEIICQRSIKKVRSQYILRKSVLTVPGYIVFCEI